MSDEEANLPSAKECQKRVEQVCSNVLYVLLRYILYLMAMIVFWQACQENCRNFQLDQNFENLAEFHK